MRQALRVSRDTLATGEVHWSALRDDGKRAPAVVCDVSALAPGDYDVVLASDLVTLDRVVVPVAQRRKLGAGLRYLVEDRLACDAERVHVAIEESPKSDSVAVAVVDRAMLDQLLRRLARSGVRARAAYPEIALPELPRGGWKVVCGAGTGFARTGELDGFALEGACADAPPLALQLAVQTARKAGGAPSQIVVSPVADAALPRLEGWAAALDLDVRSGPPWRWADASTTPALNVLQGEFAAGEGDRDLSRRLRRALVLAGVAALVVSLVLGLEWALLARERRSIDAQMHEIYQAVSGSTTPAVDPPRQLARTLADLRHRAGEPAPGDFVVLLEIVAEHVVDPGTARMERMSYDAGVLSVALRAADAERASVLRRQLAARRAPGNEIRLEQASAGPTVRFSARSAP